MKCLVVSDIESSAEEKIQFLHELHIFSSVASATTAEQAIIKLKKYAYGIVILELGPAKEDNMNLLRQIRDEKIFVCVIMLSPENNVSYISEAFGYGVSDYLLKPTSCKRLSEAAMRSVRRRSAEIRNSFSARTAPRIRRIKKNARAEPLESIPLRSLFRYLFSFLKNSGKWTGFPISSRASARIFTGFPAIRRRALMCAVPGSCRNPCTEWFRSLRG